MHTNPFMWVFAIMCFSFIQSSDMSDHFPFIFYRILWPKWEQCLQLPKTSKPVPPETCWNWPSRNCVKRTIGKELPHLKCTAELGSLGSQLAWFTRTQEAKTYLSVQKHLLEISLNFFSQKIFEKFLGFVNWFFWLILQ